MNDYVLSGIGGVPPLLVGSVPVPHELKAQQDPLRPAKPPLRNHPDMNNTLDLLHSLPRNSKKKDGLMLGMVIPISTLTLVQMHGKIGKGPHNIIPIMGMVRTKQDYEHNQPDQDKEQ
mgnify:CR=1 FL=1